MVETVTIPSRFQPSSPLGFLLMEHREAVLAIARRHGVTNVRVFGSTARGDDEAGSDIDLLVDIPPRMGLFVLERFQIDLADHLGVSVDVVPATMLNPRVAKRVNMDLATLRSTPSSRSWRKHSTTSAWFSSIDNKAASNNRSSSMLSACASLPASTRWLAFQTTA
jgi:predicted nucleotidyltransferase